MPSVFPLVSDLRNIWKPIKVFRNGIRAILIDILFMKRESTCDEGIDLVDWQAKGNNSLCFDLIFENPNIISNIVTMYFGTKDKLDIFVIAF